MSTAAKGAIVNAVHTAIAGLKAERDEARAERDAARAERDGYAALVDELTAELVARCDQLERIHANFGDAFSKAIRGDERQADRERWVR